MLRVEHSEIARIVDQLGSRSRARVDAARARLAIVGARAVEPLIAALEGDDKRVRARAMPLLALIQDPRGRGPLLAMLLDRSAKLREIAARALSRFPSADAVAALNRVLLKDAAMPVRITALQSLIEQFAGGQEHAICRPLDLLTDTNADPELRTAAFGLLPLLKAPARRGVLERLIEDPEPRIRNFAGRWGVGDEQPVTDIHTQLERLGSDDYATWNDAVHGLGAAGSRAIAPLVAELRAKAHDPEYCARAGMALKALGPRRARGLVDALDTLHEPLPLQVLVDAIGAMGEKSMIYRLRDLISRIAALPPGPGSKTGFDPMQRVRSRAHLELARIGSRVAIDDLRDLLGDPDRPVDVEALEAVTRIGSRDELSVLLCAFGREDASMRKTIADVVRAIMRRERIRRNDRMFRGLEREQRRALDSIRPPARSGPHRATGA